MSDLERRLRSALHDETSGLMAHPTMAEDMIVRGTRVRRRRRVAGGVACVAVLAVLVPVWRTIDNAGEPLRPVGPSPSVTNPGPTSTPPTSTPPTRTPPTGPSSPAWRALPVNADHAAQRQPRVLDVRVGEHATYDRVVVDFDGAISGYQIQPVSRLVQEGSGAEVRLPGTDKILIRLTAAVAHTPQGQSTYHGPQRAEYSMPALRGVAFLGDFEGVSLGLGVDDLTTVRVIELADPTRLVLDLRH
jgi:hypothetical protein